MFRTQSQVRHLSWEELNEMIASLANQIKFAEKVECVNFLYKDDTILAALLALHLGLPLHTSVDTKKSGCLKFSTYSETNVDCCLFRKKHFVEHYNHDVKYFIEEIEVEEDGYMTKTTMPWKV